MIAFSRARQSNDTDRAIYLANANGSGVRKLTSKPDDTTSVTVRPAGSGSSLSTFELEGQVPNVALSPSILAVLVRTTAGARIELRRPLERSAARSLAVPASTAPVLSASGHRVVYRVGRTIWLLNTSSMKTSAIATAASTPIGLSIEGRRIAWAENGGGRGRIRAVTLPRA
jgi:hypothetical protein